MELNTTRFGVVKISETDVLDFPEGILGFNGLQKFVLIDDPTDEIFVWLQSCDNPGIAFPVLEPELFYPDYDFALTKADREGLKLGPGDAFRMFTIITIPEDPKEMTANLKAPLIINVPERLAKQCVLQDNNLAIREPVFTRLHQRMSSNPSKPLRQQPLDLGVAVTAHQKDNQGEPEASR